MWQVVKAMASQTVGWPDRVPDHRHRLHHHRDEGLRRRSEFYANVLGLERSKRWGKMPAGEFETGNLTIAVM